MCFAIITMAFTVQIAKVREQVCNRLSLSFVQLYHDGRELADGEHSVNESLDVITCCCAQSRSHECKRLFEMGFPVHAVEWAWEKAHQNPDRALAYLMGEVHNKDDIYTIAHRHPALLQSFITKTPLHSAPSALLDMLVTQTNESAGTHVNVIDRIVAMGFDRQAVETMYRVCEHNEQLTISMLLGQ